MALASVVVGAHGTMIEVHPDPEHALSDGPQSLHFKEFEKLLVKAKGLIAFQSRRRDGA
jgi:3-deoxy-7-phosphoheptulonate synthase